MPNDKAFRNSEKVTFRQGECCFPSFTRTKIGKNAAPHQMAVTEFRPTVSPEQNIRHCDAALTRLQNQNIFTGVPK